MRPRSKKYVLTLLTKFRNQSLTRKIGILLLSIIAIAGTGFFLLYVSVLAGIFGSLPDGASLKQIKNPIASEIYSADSVLLGRFYIQERASVPFNKISPNVINALVATEDHRFYNHGGVDYYSLVRVFVKSILLQKESSGGGSTITQQLVKNLYPRKSYLLLSLPINKVREVIVARRLEDLYSKEEILELYLNTVSFGDNTFGIQAASQRFFSLPAEKISIDQAAVLIGMLKANYYYNPRVFPDRAMKRRNVVISQMNKYEFVSNSAADSLKELPIELAYNNLSYHDGLAPYFRAYIKNELMAWCNKNIKEEDQPYNLYTDGLKIYTTIDSRLQKFAEAAVKKHMPRLQDEFNRHWGKSDPWKNDPKILEQAIKRSERYKNLKAVGMTEEEILLEMKKAIPMNVFTWDGAKEMKLSPIDSIRHYLRFLNTGLLAMSPSDGSIKAWVGGIDHHYFQFDHVKETTKRQVGSTFKPIVYAAALEQGISPCDYISAERTQFTNLKNWTPSNGEENYGLKYSMEGALTYSVNTASVKLLEKGGIDNTVELARKMGITSAIPRVPSIALGTPSISMMEMIIAYSIFANEGKRVDPFYITSIADHEGRVLERFNNAPLDDQIMSPENAAIMIEMLKGVINEGTGSSLRSRYGLKGDIAGKTGTTQSNADGWFMAITPKLVVGTWVGADDPGIRFRTTALGQGAHTALPIFAEFYRQVSADPKRKEIASANFAPLSAASRRQLSCALFKEDKTFLERIFGKDEDEEVVTREFGKEKKKEKEGFFKRLFKKKSSSN
ncbi:MAG TPA: transglycosylase domain-containing protein [Cyclobacteriaceae bacterium]|nr:transglycosylase domain-containing protein [Cyclobacteriaceae bacterium]